MAAVRQPVEQFICHLYIIEDLSPFTEIEMDGVGDTAVLVKLDQKMEQQRVAGRAERQVAKLIKDDQVDLTATLAIFQPFQGHSPAPAQSPTRRSSRSAPCVCDARSPER